MQNKKIVIVEDDPYLRQQIALSLSKEYKIIEATDRIEASRILLEEKPELVLVDLNLPPTGKSQEGLKLVEEIKRNDPNAIVIVMSGNTDMKTTLKAVQAGAYDYFKKPFDLTDLKLIIRRASQMQEISKENERLRQELHAKYSFESIVGQSPAMLLLFDAIRRVAGSSASVIIRGESGTGKELIARAIHYNSPRSQKPFVSVNCAALPEGLVESELFGHERGAFTGAVATHSGRFSLADGGTLLLDEIGSVPPLVQAKLLRVLQERSFERVGGTRRMHADVRLITATNEDLEAKVERGEFREDLYYRINVFPIHVPPLRERKEDIPMLLDHFLRLFCIENSIRLKKIDSDALDALTAYAWKGNVRELENLVQTLVLMSDQENIGVSQLPSYILGFPEEVRHAHAIPEKGINMEKAVEQFERQLIQSALQKAKGVKTKAAKLLGIDKDRMKYLCRIHKI